MHHADLIYLSSSVYALFVAIADSIDIITSTNSNRIVGEARDIGDIVKASEIYRFLDVEVFVLDSATVLLKFLKIMVVTTSVLTNSREARIVFEPVDSTDSSIMIFAYHLGRSITGIKIANMVLVWEGNDEHVASRAELDFLNFFSSFQGNFSVTFKFFCLHIHELNFVCESYNDLKTARVECNCLSFLTWLVHVVDLKSFC